MTFPFLDHSYLDGHGAGVLPLSSGSGNPGLGQELLMNDSGALSPVSLISHSPFGSSSSHTTSSAPATPAPTLVSATGSKLEIELVWDKSVANAPSGFTSAVIAAAQTLVSDYTASSTDIVYIDVGWSEIAGSSLSPSALGESESYGYLTNYSTVTHALANDGYSFTASNEPTNGQFFVTSAEAKALGLISGTSGSTSSVDGYIGFSTLSGTGYSWNFSSMSTSSTQFSLQAVAEHEITEVMGRVAMEGTVTYNGVKTYTPLDLFNYSSPNVLSLSANGGYFSANGGVTHEGNFNDAAKYGGDIADWASYSSVTQAGTLSSGEDPFNAFAWPGYKNTLSADDLLEVAALGYHLTSAGAALA